jgi:hypothetical protein
MKRREFVKLSIASIAAGASASALGAPALAQQKMVF